MKAKVLIIIPGGIEPSLRIPIIDNFVREMAKSSELHVLSITKVNIDQHEFPFTAHSLQLDPHDGFLTKLLAFRKFLKSFKTRVSLDLVHSIWTHPHGLFAMLGARAYNIPFINSLQGGCLADLRQYNYGANRYWYKKRLSHYILKKAKFITAETHFQTKALATAFHAKSRIIYYGIEADLKVKKSEKKNGRYDIIQVGNITPIKDQVNLLKAFEIISRQMDVRLRIIGPDYDKGRIHQMVEEKGLSDRVKFTGRISHEDVLSLMSNSDLLLHTSVYESTCMAVIEAWTVGLPVVSTRVGIMSDLDNECCLTADVGDYKGLAEQCVFILKNDNRRKALIENAKEWTKTNSFKDCIDSFNQLYKECLK